MGDISNKSQEAVGKVKAEAGDFTGDRGLAAQGRQDQAMSKAKQAMEDAKDAVRKLMDRVKGMFKK